MLVRAFPAPDLRRRVTYSPANPYASAGGFQEAMIGQRFLRLMPPERKICGKKGQRLPPLSIFHDNRKPAKRVFDCTDQQKTR